MNLFDSHSHYNDEKYDFDRSEILDTIYKEGITRVVCAGYNVEQSKQAIEIASKTHYMFATCGISPNSFTAISSNSSTSHPISNNLAVVASKCFGITFFINISPFVAAAATINVPASIWSGMMEYVPP